MVPKHVAVVDTETTGVEKDCAICELAAYNEYCGFETLVNPGRPIPPEASAVHHISNDDVVDAIDETTALQYLDSHLKRNEVTVLVAHNAGFDQPIIERVISGYEWVCTYKCALWLWPDAPSHKNEALCYWLGLGDNGRRFSQGSHSALHDARRTYLLLNKMLELTTLEQLIAWTKLPKEIRKLPFGKHVGKTWAEVDYGYLKWMTGQPDMDPDMLYHAKAEIKRRFG